MYFPGSGGRGAQLPAFGPQHHGQQQHGLVPDLDTAPTAAKRRRSGAATEGCVMCRLRKVRQATAPGVLCRVRLLCNAIPS